MVQTFRTGMNCVVRFEPTTSTGESPDIESVQYRVTDQDGVERVALTALDEANIVDSEILVPIDAAVNGLAEGSSRELRSVEIRVTTPDEELVFVEHYFIEGINTLRLLENSFQTLPQAMLVGAEVANIDAWDTASDDRKNRALTEAFRNIAQLSFRYEFSDSQSRITDKLWFSSDIRDLTASEYNNLDEDFRKALCVAQVIEANALLGGSDVSNLRRDGLMSASVGEVSQMFRPGKPLVLSVSRRALEALSGYVNWSRGVSR